VAKDQPEKDQDERIADLKSRVEELCGGQMEAGGLDDCSSEIEEGFWKQVVEYEQAPWTTNFQQLEEAGVSLPHPDSLSDQELPTKLWEVIQKLALLRVFIDQTDHLSDRELYTHLWTDSLREETKMLPLSENAACHIPLLGSGSEESTLLYLKFYADEREREAWLEDFPGDTVPEHEDPPYKRDHLLPKATYSSPVDQEPN